MMPRLPSLLFGAFLLSTSIPSVSAFQLGPPKSFTPSPSSKPTLSDVLPSIAEDAVNSAKNFATMAALASSVALGAISLNVPPAQAIDTSRTIQVEVDAPVLVRRLETKFYEKELLDALHEVEEVIGPDAIKVTPPSNIPGAARDLLSGRGEITVNGKPVDVAILSSDKGEITFRISNSLIPKIPIVSTRANIPFTGTASDENEVVDNSGGYGTRELGWDLGIMEVVARTYGWDMTTPFFDQKFLGGSIGIPVPRADDRGGDFTYYPTNKDVAGVTSLTLGAAYASSYTYYVSLIKEAERKAEEKAAADKAKKEKAAKAKAAKAKAAKAKAKADEAVTAEK